MSVPKEHQTEAARAIVDKFGGRALLADSMGLGKSLTSLLATVRASAFPVVVVCPAGLKHNWQRECTKHLGLRSDILSGTKAPSNRAESRTSDVAPVQIINYEILNTWMTRLQLIEPKMLIVDEGHNLSNRNSQRSRYVRELAADIPNVIVLSGTALPNRPADLWNILNLVRPELYGDFFAYALKYCELKKEYGFWNYRGASDLPGLHAELTDRLMIRRRREDVIKDLPEMQRTVLPIPISDRAAYKEKVRALLSAFRDQSAKKPAMSMLGDLLVDVGQRKLSFVRDWIDDFLKGTDEKMLVFGIHHDVLEDLHRHYRKQSVLIYGKTSQARRNSDEHAFQNDPKVRLLFGNIHASGVGLNLTAATTVAFVELPWRPADLEQAAARCYARLGDMHGASVYYLVGLGTIEEHMIQLLQKKQDIADQVIDGRPGVSDFDLADQLLDHLEKEGGA